MIRLNIACGPNMFPGWRNLDRVDMTPYLQQIAAAATNIGWPDWQARLAREARRGLVDFRVWDLRSGFRELHEDGTVDAIYLGQMIEHLNPIHEAPPFLQDCFRMLKRGGVVRITTPNFEQLLREYAGGSYFERYISEMPGFFAHARREDRLAYLMFGSAGPDSTWDNYEGHHHLYTPDTLAELLESCGFDVIVDRRDWRFEDAVDLGMSYGFALEAVKP